MEFVFERSEAHFWQITTCYLELVSSSFYLQTEKIRRDFPRFSSDEFGKWKLPCAEVMTSLLKTSGDVGCSFDGF